MTTPQIPLGLYPEQLYQLSAFHYATAELSTLVEDFCNGKNERFIYLWGGEAVGKTHLAIAIVDAVKQHKRAVYLSLQELISTAAPDILQGLEGQCLVCLDEVEAVMGNRGWEQALFHCFNHLYEAGVQLLVLSRFSPRMLPCQLADLQSRLRMGLTYHIPNLSDTDKQQVLIRQAKIRGLLLPDSVAEYLLRQYSRDMVTLIHYIQQLDNASMAAKRRLTIPFVKQILGYGAD
ncbi:MAG TPA: DnaA regulatory inactivator Hda [Gammaproteobacteria bacterium]|nr:DnaA regulatory inactivator Hda [Gammaproteobacteria bacterium]